MCWRERPTTGFGRYVRNFDSPYIGDDVNKTIGLSGMSGLWTIHASWEPCLQSYVADYESPSRAVCTVLIQFDKVSLLISEDGWVLCQNAHWFISTILFSRLDLLLGSGGRSSISSLPSIEVIEHCHCSLLYYWIDSKLRLECKLYNCSCVWENVIKVLGDFEPKHW